MTEPLDLEPIKARLAYDPALARLAVSDPMTAVRLTNARAENIAEDAAALIREVERLRAHRDRVRMFVWQMYGVNITDDPEAAEVVVRV